MQPSIPVDPRAIPVRRPALELSRALPRYWNGGGAFATHFLNALSSVFPEGEAFFVRSVLHYRNRIDDAALQRRIRGFAGQEGQHSHQHERHVRMLLEQGYTALAWRDRLMGRMQRWSNRRLPRLSLAATAALEHLTALLARQILSHPERFTGAMDARMAPLWQWHALEEAEHKAVAFDVLQRVAPSYALRAFALAANSVFLLLEILDRTTYLLWKDGVLLRRATWSEGWRFLLGRGGLLRGLGRDYRAWFRRDFHPDQIDDTPLIEAGRARIAAVAPPAG